jgi:hypothetical protein
MSAQPVHHHGPRVPRSIDGIAGALSAPQRMEFYRELGPVEAPAEREAVLATWWLRAMSAVFGNDRVGFRAAVAPVLATTRVGDLASLVP